MYWVTLWGSFPPRGSVWLLRDSNNFILLLCHLKPWLSPKGEFPSSMPAFKCFGPKMILVITVLTSLVITNCIVLSYCKRALRSSLPISPEEPNMESPSILYYRAQRSMYVCIQSIGVKSMDCGMAIHSLAIYLAVWSKASYMFSVTGFFPFVKWRR